MAKAKRYYWIKLMDNFFDDDGPADFMMGQPSGSDYVVLYQMLCLKTINTDGRLANRIGEMIIPYDVEKIRRTCKYFSTDTIRVALNLYKMLGLIYEDIDGALILADHKKMVGSETDAAARMRSSRENRPSLPSLNPESVTDDVTDGVTTGEQKANIVTTEIRDKEIRDIRDLENRDQEIRFSLSDSDESDCRAEAQRVIGEWNMLPIESKVQRMSVDSTRAKSLRARIREYGVDKVIEAVRMVYNSDFLLGRKTDFQITFDWFVKPNNFAKVVSGNYNNRVQQQPCDTPAMDSLKTLHDMFIEEESPS